MSLIAFQELLVTLAADRTARRRFAADRAALLGPADLDARERAALAALPLAALERYAESLLHKRWQELARVVPLTLRVVPDLGARYRRWLGDHPVLIQDGSIHDGPLAPGVAEGRRALEPLRVALARDEGLASYAADLFGYEVLSACARADGVPRTLQARFALHELVRALSGPTVPIDPAVEPTVYRFERDTVRWRRA